MGHALILVLALAAAAPLPQQAITLHITVTVTTADGQVRPVPRHALLISDDPVTAAPQRVVTTIEGTADVRLQPGAYMVESDTPFLFAGKAYEWSQPVKVAASGETRLTLTAGNATIEAAKAGSADSPAIAAAEQERAEASLLAEWQASVVTIWTPRASGRGFFVDGRGLIATNQRLVGKDTAVEVQLSATRKIAGRVIASDAGRNVAIVWVDPQAMAPAKPMTPAFAQGDTAAVRERDTVYSLEGRTGEPKNLVSGAVDRVTAHTVASDLQMDRDSSGSPIFTAAGTVVAIATAGDDASDLNEVSPRAVRIDDAKPAMAEAEKNMQGAAPPAATPLPVDPDRAFPRDVLENAVKARAKATAYAVAASEFDVNIITPPVLYAALHPQEDGKHFDYARDDAAQGQPPALRPLDDFGTWNAYVSDAPPVVLIRVTPKFGEKFWTTVARGAAQTQGVAIPAIKRPKAVFGGLRLSCGGKEVAPIHPFRVEHPLGGTASIDEGLYVFDPSAISPQCGTVTITLFSDKAADKGDARVIDARVVQQVWEDFAPYRAAK